MMDLKLSGLIYKTMSYQENSKLLFVYTKKGKKTLVSKGSLGTKNQNRILSQYLTHIEFEDKDKEMFALKDAKMLHDFNAIKSDYDQVIIASKLLFAIDKLMTTDLPHDKIFDELIKVLNEPRQGASIYALLLKLLRPLGYEPTLFIEGELALGFNIEHGTIVTKNRPFKIDFDLEALKVVIIYYYSNYEALPTLDNLSKEVLEAFINAYYAHHLMCTFK